MQRIPIHAWDKTKDGRHGSCASGAGNAGVVRASVG